MAPQNDILVVGFVGHTTIENLASLKRQIDQLPHFQLVFFKTSSDKLWIKEGDHP